MCSTRQNEGHKILNMTTITSLNGHPTDEQGIERGVSAAYTAILDNHLVMAGGCNFPSQEASDRLEKRFYKGIYAAPLTDADSLEWKKIGELPVASAYGAAIQSGDRLCIIGGQTFDRSLRDAVSIRLENGKAVIDTLPSFPVTVDNTAGAELGGKLYVACGNQDGKQSSEVLALDLENIQEGWKPVPQMPDTVARVQPVCAAAEGCLYVFGGFANAAGDTPARLAVDGWRYSPESGEWTAVPGPQDPQGEPLTLSGGIGATVKGSIYCVGGVNKDIFLDAISGTYAFVNPSEYAFQPIEWYRFNPNLLCFDPQEGQWRQTGMASPSLARAGAALAAAGETIYVIGGELKPRVRTPEIVKITE